MKKLCILVLCYLFLQTYIKSQNFPDHVVWHYETLCGTSAIICDCSFQKLEIYGDTIIQGLECKIITKSSEYPLVNETEYPEEYVSKAGDKIYWFNQQTENFTVLYDFGADPGDTWEITVYDCFFYVTIDSISYTQYNGVTKKNLFLSDENNYFSGKVIEDIGNTISFFPRDIFFLCKYNTAPDGQHICGLRCYEDDFLSINLMDKPCDTSYVIIPYTIPENRNSFDLKISPNPFVDRLWITHDKDFPINSSYYLWIYGTDGRKIMYQEIYKDKQEIILPKFTKGAYLLQVVSDDFYMIKTIIKQ